MTRRARFAAAAAFVLVAATLGSTPTRAQNAKPATPTPTPETGYVASGKVTIQSAVSGLPVQLTSTLASEQRGPRIRLDLISITVPAGNPLASAAATQVFPPGGVTIVFDRRDGTFTLWSVAKRTYFVGHALKPAAASATPTPTPDPSATRPDPFAGQFGALRSLKDDKTLSLSIALTGHSMLFGHPVSNVHFAFAQAKISDDRATDLHGDVAFADDFDGAPIQFIASLTAKGVPPSSIEIDIPQLVKRLPPDADFSPPSGFTQVQNVFDILAPQQRHDAPAPVSIRN